MHVGPHQFCFSKMRQPLNCYKDDQTIPKVIANQSNSLLTFRPCASQPLWPTRISVDWGSRKQSGHARLHATAGKRTTKPITGVGVRACDSSNPAMNFAKARCCRFVKTQPTISTALAEQLRRAFETKVPVTNGFHVRA